MPLFDRKCVSCEWVGIDLWEPVNVGPAVAACPSCGAATERAWLSKPPVVIQDSMDHWQVNGTRDPIHFTSKQERRRWLKETNQCERVRHVGVNGTDKSPHTTRMVAMDQYTLDNARELLERSAQQPARNEPDDPPMRVRTVIGDVGSPEWEAFRGR